MRVCAREWVGGWVGWVDVCVCVCVMEREDKRLCQGVPRIQMNAPYTLINRTRYIETGVRERERERERERRRTGKKICATVSKRGRKGASPTGI